MTDFAGLAEAAGSLVDPAELKQRLPLPYVLERYGVQGGLSDDGSWHAVCPFHDDSDPSFDVFGDNLERWGCWPCGLAGDLYDLLQKLGAAKSFNGALQVAEVLVADMQRDGWAGPSKAPARVFDVKAAADRVQAAHLATAEADNGLERLVAAKGYDFDAAWLTDTFGVGIHQDTVIIPHYDREGLIGYKHRTAGQPPIAAGGTKFTCLYGTWRDTGNLPVLLCEGESDTWAGAYAVGADYDVLGLPTGSGTPPAKFVDQLKDRTVTIAFDGDDAGRLALRRWHPALLGAGCDVRVIPLPDDMDLAKLPNIAEVVARARAVPVYPTTALLEIDGGYARKSGQDGHTMVSNWTFTPRRELLAEDGSMAYEGVVAPSGQPAVLSSLDLSSKASIVKWANSVGGAWFGSDRDAQVLLAMLQAIGPFLPTGRMTMIAGLHDWHFVGPGIKLGPDYWQYVAPPGDIELARDVTILRGEWSTEQVHILRTLHDPEVMDPILAWLAAAPLRSVLHSFPYLGVTGSSGTGKSTLLETVLRQFTGTKVTTNLTSTTRYAVSAMAEATNGIPVWFDEYRPGARLDTITAVNQILRDAFDGAASARGGMRDHWAKVTRRAATAPLIVSGEDAFEETSLVQRMVAIAMPLAGKDPAMLERVQGWPTHGLAYAYLEWLVGSTQLGRLWRFENYETGPEALPSRNRLGLGVLDLGWKLLSRFVDEHGGRELGEPNWSLVIGEAAEAATHSPIEDAIKWAVDEIDAYEFIGRDDADIWLRVPNFVEFVSKGEKFRLPGGSKAIRKYLTQHYAASETTITALGGQKRALRIPDGVARLLG